MGLVAYLDDGRAAARPRRSTRRTLRLEVAATAGSGSAAMVIHDLSPTGLLIETDEALAVGQKLSVELPEVGKFPAEAVWSSGRFVGCRFDETLPQAAISAALLRSDRPGVRPEAASPAPVQELQARVQRQLAYAGGEKAAAAAVGEPLAEYDRLPLHVRGRIMVGLAAGSGAIWAVLLWGVGVI